jgi:adenosylhomocysteinase
MPTPATAPVPCDIKDLTLADHGKRRLEWAVASMAVLQTARKQFIKEQPLEGVRISACLPVTAETANLMIVLRDGGATVALCASDAALTQDDVAASLVRDYAIGVFAVSGEDEAGRTQRMNACLGHAPQIAIDSRGDLLSAAQRASISPNGATVDSGPGAAKARSMFDQGSLACPVIAVNSSASKQLFDACHGTGQLAVERIIRITGVLMAGMTVVVAGYGPSGRGVAARARGLGANVIVTEVDPSRAVQALVEGFRVAPMAEAGSLAHLVVTALGSKNTITREHIERLRDGAILCNAGHAANEIDVEAIGRTSTSRREVREGIEEFKLKDGRRVYLLAGGRLIANEDEGRPAAIADMNCASQALAVEYLVRQQGVLEARLHSMPAALDRQVARMKLAVMGVSIDKLTIDQEEYLAGWAEGN